MVTSWIVHSVSNQIAQSVIWFDSAADVWNDLKDRFSQGDNIRVSELQKEIQALVQGSLAVNDYYTQLKTLWDELSNYRPLPKCACIPICNCGAILRFRSYKENDQVITFLRGLNANFSTICSQILLQEPLPQLNRVFALAIQHERHLNSYNPLISHIEPTAFVATQTFQPRFSQNPNSGFKKPTNGPSKLHICNYCGKEGHMESSSYKKHGYPQGYNSKYRKQNARANQVQMQHHDENQDEQYGEQYSHPQADLDHEPFMLTRGQYQQIMNLIPADSKTASQNVASSSHTVTANSNQKLTYTVDLSNG
ncbi:uncharacterized protein [Euphorbia lathyris]|uniref:uncharacterized protein isoform X2 n=1 Tax=Euphorbia lathyris TaxID=212925 RepID=UPI0033137CF2